MQILMTIVYIIIFIVCLSFLIMIHEAGHLLAAKAFKVYCFEYSIGFGPKLFSKRRKNGETAFSLRAIPFGGFVSMYGEDVPVPEGLEIPPERSLDGIKKWKKGIILVAGVTMNAVLALVIFFISNIAFPVVEYSFNPVTINETNMFVDRDAEDNLVDVIEFNKDVEKTKTNTEIIDNYFIISNNAVVEKKDASLESGVSVLLYRAISGTDKLDWSNNLKFIKLDENYNIVTSYNPDQNIAQYSFSVSMKHHLGYDEEGKETFSEPKEVHAVVGVEKVKDEYVLKSTGISITQYKYWLKGKAFGQTFVDFGQSSTAIVRGIGSLFVSSEARDGVGGIIAIGFETTNILKNFGINSFMRVWGLVSVNLAIVNLLPFPGLDGWQLLVLIVEGISKKKIPDKVKNIVSLVGLILLFGLMILLVFKDIFKYII